MRTRSSFRQRVLYAVRYLMLLSLGGLAGWTGARRVSADTNDPAAVRWQSALIETRDLSATVLATGVVRPAVGAQVAVGSRISGVLRRLHVTVGDRVRAGQLLAELDAVEQQTRLERSAAALTNAAAERELADQELARARRLFERNVIAPAEWARVETAAATARAREREAAAAVRAAEVELGYTQIRAPIDGVVGSVSTQEGETVAANFAAPTFVTIVDLARLEVWAYVDETDIGRIEPGQTARFTIDTYPGEELEGRVTAIRPTAELRENVVTYITLIEITPTQGKVLRPEMTATVHIDIAGRNEVLAVPNAAIRRDASGSWVQLTNGARLERRTVQLGFRASQYTEVIAGLTAGERVLTSTAVPCSAEPGGTP